MLSYGIDLNQPYYDVLIDAYRKTAPLKNDNGDYWRFDLKDECFYWYQTENGKTTRSYRVDAKELNNYYTGA